MYGLLSAFFPTRIAPVAIVLLGFFLPSVVWGNGLSQRGETDPQAGDEQQQVSQPAQATPAGERVWGPFTVSTQIEAGFRWRDHAGGSREMYRSQVNLGRGPKLFSSSLNLASPPESGYPWDRLRFTFDNWGGEPYNVGRLSLTKNRVYEFDFNYQNIQYFNFIPTFSNPLLDQGVFLSQHSFDISRRLIHANLELWPNATVHPYLAYSRSRGEGPVRTTFDAEGDEFVLGANVRDSMDEYRGGIRFRTSRLNFTLEQGARIFKDDQSVSFLSGFGEGNSRLLVFGRPVVLTGLARNYHARGTTPVTRALLQATPVSSLSVDAQLTYTNADLDLDHDQTYAGSFVSFGLLRAFTGRLDGTLAKSQRPGILGDVGLDFELHPRFRLNNLFQVHRYHISGNARVNELFQNTTPLTGPPLPPQDLRVTEGFDQLLSLNLHRNQVMGILELHRDVTARGGYRYTFRETRLETEEHRDRIDSSQHAFLAGLAWRLSQRAELNLDLEVARTDDVFFRTALSDYERARFRVRVQPFREFWLSGHISEQENRDEKVGLDFASHQRGYGVNVTYQPSPRFAVALDYNAGDVGSDLIFRLPQTLTTDRSAYVEDSHYGNLYLDVGLIRGSRVTLGYGVLGTTGTFPLNYHQPLARFSIPLGGGISWTAGWQYYGYNEKGRALQDYRDHLFSMSLVLTY
ncbi:MAG: hypothetical protein HY652_09760 [Acidobacteria bacterium]|nr:hypothetical protein [Acidobacteriota bacterium]